MTKELGKIGVETIKNSIQEKCGAKREEVSTGPGFGLDVSVVDLPGKMALLSTSDPLSLIPSLGLEESAWLSVHLMANDMATSGFAPQYAQMVLNLPATFSKSDFQQYWDYINKFCKQIGLAITGGHTGFIEGQNSTIAGGGTFSTIAPKAEVVLSKNAEAGDLILMTKSCAMSSSAILGMSFPETVRNKLGKEIQQKCEALFYETSSLQDGLTAAGENKKYPEIHAMHDVTEGGVLGAVYEMLNASEKGGVIYDENINISEVQRQVCDLFNLDPRFCIGAGSMLISCKRGREEELISRLQQENIPCKVIGEVKEKDYGIKIREDNKEKNLPYLEEDPYWAAFFKALSQNLK